MLTAGLLAENAACKVAAHSNLLPGMQQGDRQTLNLPRSGFNLQFDAAGLRSGERIALCMEPQAILEFTLFFYLVPLAAMLAATAVASLLGRGELAVMGAALLGLVSGFFLLPGILHQQQQRHGWRPALKQLQPESSSGAM